MVTHTPSSQQYIKGNMDNGFFTNSNSFLTNMKLL